MRISDWSSDVCSSDLGFECIDILDLRIGRRQLIPALVQNRGGKILGGRKALSVFLRCHYLVEQRAWHCRAGLVVLRIVLQHVRIGRPHFIELRRRSEEHTSELKSLMRTSYAVFCLKKKHRYLTIISV